MIKFVLIVWVGSVTNYADYSEFNTLRECEEKRQQVAKALTLAESNFRVECVIRPTEEKK
jgi:hypothetical protein